MTSIGRDTLQNLLNETLNPPFLNTFHDAIFCGDEESSDLLKQFDISHHTYQIVWPKNLPSELKAATNSNGMSYFKQLNAFIAAPLALCAASETTHVRCAIRFHGGGGMTGKPLFCQWVSRADFMYMVKAGNMISVEPEYCLMPECSGLDIIQNVKAFCKWLFTSLPEAVRSINPNLEVKWSCLSIFGESFGGLLAMILYLEIGSYDLKPSDLRISGILLRCPVSEVYKREAGSYCGKFIPRDSAKRTCQTIDQIMKEMDWVEIRSSVPPPDGMFGAYCSSVSGSWESYWGTSCLPDRIRNASECPDRRTIIWIKHGEDDLHVPHQSSQDLATTLREKWPGLQVIFTLIPGKEHAWDRSEPLESVHEHFLEQL